MPRGGLDNRLRHTSAKSLALVPIVPTLDRHDQMEPFAPGGFEETLQSQLLEKFPHLPRACNHPAPLDLRVRIEIEDQPVRSLQLVGSRSPGMDFQGGDL